MYSRSLFNRFPFNIVHAMCRVVCTTSGTPVWPQPCPMQEGWGSSLLSHNRLRRLFGRRFACASRCVISECNRMHFHMHGEIHTFRSTNSIVLSFGLKMCKNLAQLRFVLLIFGPVTVFTIRLLHHRAWESTPGCLFPPSLSLLSPGRSV